MNYSGLKSFLFTSELAQASGSTGSTGSRPKLPLPAERSWAAPWTASPGPSAPAPRPPSSAGALLHDAPAPFELIERLEIDAKLHPEMRHEMRQTVSGPLSETLSETLNGIAPTSPVTASVTQESYRLPSRPGPPPLFRNEPSPGEPEPAGTRAPEPHSPAPGQLQGVLQGVLPAFIGLKARLLQDLEANLGRLPSLNISRREAIAQHLDRLAGQVPPQATGGLDAATRLRRWIEGPRSPAQSAAIQAYLEEVALILLGQAVLLKAWSDRGVRSWAETDLQDLNWTMNSVLKPHLPLDRESWQVARQNIYSWYKPSPLLQREVWQRLSFWRIGQEGPHFLSSLVATAKKASSEHRDPEGYDSRFLKAVWELAPAAGFDPRANPGPIRRPRAVFSPTLRDGAMVRTGPASLVWAGLEASPFLLMLCELMQLWWGMAAPPLWAIGDGLEVHTRDQLSLALGSPKPSLVSRISEMEAFDAAFVLEELPVRAQGRAPEAQRFREQVDSIPYFRKLRSPGTTLGDLQACVALSKLRPGGLLFWAREEPLDERDGGEILNFMLDRARLACEWNFSSLTHSLPAPRPLFPRYLYLFCREPRVEERLSHRPLRITVAGQLRSHVELPLLFEEALGAMSRPLSPARGHWQVHVLQSPTAQRDWADHWPDPASQQTMRFLDRLRESSLPLASATNIRHTPEGDPARQGGWSAHPSLKGFWIQAQGGVKPVSGEAGDQRRRLIAHPLPKPGRPTQGVGFLVLVADEAAVAPLKHYLESEAVSQWLEFNCERKGDRWLLTEQVVRYLPVPLQLLQSLRLVPEGAPEAGGIPLPASSEEVEAPPTFALPLPGEWERLATELADHPEGALKAVQSLRNGSEARSDHALHIMAEIFVRASRVLEHVRESQGPLLRLVSPAGKIRWRELLKVLPRGELAQISLHSGVRLIGNLPLHLPIGQISLVKTPRPGILLATELGMSMRIVTDSSVLLEMLWDQLEGLSSPTWGELLNYVRVPRRIDLAETTASDILKGHGAQSRKLRDLVELLASCSLF